MKLVILILLVQLNTNFYFCFDKLNTKGFPKCKDCKHFILNQKHNEKKDMIELGHCEKFGEYNNETHKNIHCYAEICRKFDYLCGNEGKYFEKAEYSVEDRILHNKLFLLLIFLMGNNYFSFTLFLLIINKIIELYLEEL